MKLHYTSSTVIAATGLAASFFTTSANASLVGSTITASGNNLFVSGTDLTSTTIGSNIEFTGINSFMNFDFDANTLTITGSPVLWRGFGDYVFSNFDVNINNVSILTNTGFNGTIVDNFSFDSNSITLDMSDSTRSKGSILVYSIQTSPVPIPASIWLFGTGLFGLLGVTKRKK